MKQNKHTSQYTQCRGCGKRILLSYFKYCPDCAKLALRLVHEHISPKAKKGFWAYLRRHGRKCCLSGVSLEIDDDTSPWYLVFSRQNPGDKAKIFPASALFTVMKWRLLKREFRYYVLALDDHRKKHLKVKKIPLVHWQGLEDGEKLCAGCKQTAAVKGHKYCATCSKISYRMKLARFPREAINRDHLSAGQ